MPQPPMRDLPVEVVRSRRRRRTVHAEVSDGKVRVLVPDGMDPATESQLVDRVVGRLRTRLATGEIDLEERARSLARRYHLPQPVTVEWSHRQMRRWGSCTPDDGRIRISSRLANVPTWVLDSVIVHELAHLLVPGHGREFTELVARYELQERATGYLMALGDGSGHQAHEDSLR
jgi:predicted metal-dependent hydrolase